MATDTAVIGMAAKDTQSFVPTFAHIIEENEGQDIIEQFNTFKESLL